MKSKLKAPGTKRLKLRYDHLVSIFAFNSNLRRYNTGEAATVAKARKVIGDGLFFFQRYPEVRPAVYYAVLRPSTKRKYHVTKLVTCSQINSGSRVW